MKKILMVLLLLIVAFLIFVATRPNTFHIERSVSIAAPADAVFAKIDDFHQWAAWSPWEKLDPAMQKSYEGAASGVGAGYHWSGNKAVGEGRMNILESVPGQKVGIRLEFITYHTVNTATFILAPEGAGTHVTWSLDGPMNFISKAMCIFTSMDSMIGPDFARGLAGLKSVAESAAHAPAGAAPDSAAARKAS